MTAVRIAIAADINTYFEEALTRAMRTRRVDATDAATHYLVGLLADQARPDSAGVALIDAPLTFQLRDALEARGADRFERLRGLGDRVLYLLGFFRGVDKEKAADRRYVLSLGASAYGHAAAMLRGGGGHGGPDVLTELARKFERFVAVLAELSDGSLAASAQHRNGSLVQLYERWLASGSDTLAEELAARGMFPVAKAGGLH